MAGPWTDPRKPYRVVISGIEHTFLLNDEDAKRYPDATPEDPEKTSRTSPKK